MAALPAILSIAGTVVSAAGSIAAGNAQKAAADFEAAQLKQNAQYETASAQRDALEADRKGKLVASNQLAAGAASGFGVGDNDPSFQNLTYTTQERAKLQGEMATFGGGVRAQNLQNHAAATLMEGRNAQQAGYINAFSSVLGGASSFFKTYGGGGPNLGNATPADSYYGF